MTIALNPGLERRLKAHVEGDILFDIASRGRYATDASHYQMMPLGVVVPRTIAEAEKAIAVARSEGVTVLARGGGSSQCGQTVNHSLVIDCSKHLNKIVSLDAAGKTCVVQPGITLIELAEALTPSGLRYPVFPGELSGSLGGNVNTNAGGMRAVRHGVTRQEPLRCWQATPRPCAVRPPGPSGALKARQPLPSAAPRLGGRGSKTTGVGA